MWSRNAKTPKERPKGLDSSTIGTLEGTRQFWLRLEWRQRRSRQFWPGGNAESIRMISNAVIAKECSYMAGWF
jgi:hypothetical protein